MTATLLGRLRADTRAAHEALDRALDLDALTKTQERYASLLTAMYGFHAPLEPRVTRALDGIYPFVGRVDLLEEDLRHLSIDLSTVPLCTELPSVGSPAHALGVAYVLEGSALGGQVVGRYAAARLGVDATSGAGFFLSHGRAVGPEWRAFGNTLERYFEMHGGERNAIDAAKETFNQIHAWLHAEGVA